MLQCPVLRGVQVRAALSVQRPYTGQLESTTSLSQYWVLLGVNSKDELKLYFVKNNEKALSRLTKNTKKAILLSELISVTLPQSYPRGITFSTRTTEYTWIAMTIKDRADFLTILSQICAENLRSQPVQVIFSELLGESTPHKASQTNINADDYSLIAPFINNSEGFDYEATISKISSCLSDLEKQNVIDLLSLPPKGQDTQSIIEKTFDELEVSGFFLQVYDEQIKTMQEYIEEIEGSNNRMEIISSNQKKLLAEINRLTSYKCLNFDTNSISELLSKSDSKGSSLVLSLALETNDVRVEAKDYIEKSVFFRDQYNKASFVQESICSALVKYFGQALNLQSEKIRSEEKSIKESRKILPNKEFASKLKTLSLLIDWLSSTSQKQFEEICSVYSSCMQGLTRQRIRWLTEAISSYTKKTRNELLRTVLFSDEGQTPINNVKNYFQISAVLNEALLYPSIPGSYTPREAITHILAALKDLIISEWEVLKLWLPSKNNLLEINAIADDIFSDVLAKLLKFLRELLQIDPFLSLFVIYSLDSFRENPVLIKLRTVLQNEAEKQFADFVDQQTKYISSSSISLKGCGVARLFLKFPLFLDYFDKSSCLENSTENTQAKNVDPIAFSFVSLANETQKKLQQALRDFLRDSKDSHPDSKHRSLAEIENYSFVLRAFKEQKKHNRSEMTKLFDRMLHESLSHSTKLLLDAKFGNILSFFEEIDQMINVNIPVKEIQFQAKFNKQACSSLLNSLTISKCQKRLSVISHKLSQTMTTDGYDLLWIKLKRDFIRRWSIVERLSRQCYGLHAVFSSDELTRTIDNIHKANG